MEEHVSEVVDDPRKVLKPTGGRDELNLAEFPITLLSDRVPKGCKTLVFEIEPKESRVGKVAQRKVTVTGSDAYGLPTALDDEIMVALVQLTKIKNEFTTPVVYFTRYEILRLLGWPDDGRSYARIEESIKRWTGVTLYYDNAWWNKETGTWMDENFHVIEQSSLVGQETKKVRRARGQHDLALSSFTWSSVIFQSFQSGSLKRLDIDAYFSYSTSVAKRMYRFLDKRFWVKDRWEFNLKEFAFEHIGLSRNYNVAQIKNKLQPALDELSQDVKERAAFLEPMDPKIRYVKVSKGEWLILLSRKRKPSQAADEVAHQPTAVGGGLEEDLVQRGVTREVAAELVTNNAHEDVALRIEVFDWLIEKKNSRVIKESPTGYLVSSIRNRYLSLPKGFEPKAARAQKLKVESDRRREEAEVAERKLEHRRRAEHAEAQMKTFWSNLSEAEQEAFDAEALREADPARAAAYLDAKQRRNPLLKSLFKVHIRDPHVRRKLNLPEAEPAG